MKCIRRGDETAASVTDEHQFGGRGEAEGADGVGCAGGPVLPLLNVPLSVDGDGGGAVVVQKDGRHGKEGAAAGVRALDGVGGWTAVGVGLGVSVMVVETDVAA
eukprot:4792768-Pleurochrysis_carterae.AAC.1